MTIETQVKEFIVSEKASCLKHGNEVLKEWQGMLSDLMAIKESSTIEEDNIDLFISTMKHLIDWAKK